MTGGGATKRSRSVEREIFIRVPAELVWKALTDASELTRWFPLDATVTPGLGGEIAMRWPGGARTAGPIEIWESGRHLRIGGDAASPAPIATDYYLRSEKGGTVLRVVSSGFGPDADWDEQYEGWGGGWDFELRGLRHYLERHFGVSRLVAWAQARYGGSRREAWSRLIGPGGWLGDPGVSEPADGQPYVLRSAAGRMFSGTVVLWQPSRQFAGTAEAWNDGLLRVELYDSTATVWLSTYGVAPAAVAELEREWRAALPGLLI